EGRVGLRPRPAGHRGDDRQAVPHLRGRRAVPAGGRRRARPARRLLPWRRRRPRRQAGPALRGPGRGRRRGVPPLGHLLRHRRHPPAPPRRRRHGVLPRAARAVRRGGHPHPGLLRRPRPGPAPGALLVRPAHRGAGRGGGPARPAGRWRPRRPAPRGPRRCSMKVAVVQHDIVWEDKEANFARLAPMVAGAAATGARLVVLSETFSTGFSMRVDRTAEPEGGPSSRFLAEQAAAHGVWVCGSIPEVRPGDERPHNTLVLAGPGGEVHRYRKIHRFAYGGEDAVFEAGDERVTVEVEGLRLSLFVCYDLRFADDWWAVAPGTDAYVCVANWPTPRRAHWQALLRARAIENQAYVVGCNRVGTGWGPACRRRTRSTARSSTRWARRWPPRPAARRSSWPTSPPSGWPRCGRRCPSWPTGRRPPRRPGRRGRRGGAPRRRARPVGVDAGAVPVPSGTWPWEPGSEAAHTCGWAACSVPTRASSATPAR